MPFVPLATIDRTHSTSEGEATLAEPGSEVPRIAAPRVLVELFDSRLLCARLQTPIGMPGPRLGCPTLFVHNGYIPNLPSPCGNVRLCTYKGRVVFACVCPRMPMVRSPPLIRDIGVWSAACMGPAAVRV
jgi:hypothetical protein